MKMAFAIHKEILSSQGFDPKISNHATDLNLIPLQHLHQTVIPAQISLHTTNRCVSHKSQQFTIHKKTYDEAGETQRPR